MASNITPGTAQLGVIANPTGKAESTTQIGAQLTPVEHGRTAAKSAYTTTASTGPIGGSPSFGKVDTVDLVGTVSTKADATYTGAATTSRNGSGCTITYDVASKVASGTTVAAAGDGYAVGDTITIDGDTGVTYTVKTIT